ncbi:hypothetical protein J1605_019742 [Eschrichtius robustus]|uniref:Uncharacterized protein n=1 Tax=Eschrichtius robustus TaxID=9764 RepID=A0AB34HN11_ESCRO|nr:hypothetical protein J1605_019742 [Eschrichtius robustus]
MGIDFLPLRRPPRGVREGQPRRTVTVVAKTTKAVVVETSGHWTCPGGGGPEEVLSRSRVSLSDGGHPQGQCCEEPRGLAVWKVEESVSTALDLKLSWLSQADDGDGEKTGKILTEFLRFYEDQYGVALFNSMRHEIEGTGAPQAQLLWRKSVCPRANSLTCGASVSSSVNPGEHASRTWRLGGLALEWLSGSTEATYSWLVTPGRAPSSFSLAIRLAELVPPEVVSEPASTPSPVTFFGAARDILCSGFEGPGAVP